MGGPGRMTENAKLIRLLAFRKDRIGLSDHLDDF